MYRTIDELKAALRSEARRRDTTTNPVVRKAAIRNMTELQRQLNRARKTA